MARQTINIIGAGLSGLTLGRCLHQRGIPAVLYDRKPSPPAYNYGITLYASTYAPLLSVLGVDEHTFKTRLAVDAAIGGTGKINNAALGNSNKGPCFRANRGKLEAWLREGLTIKPNYVLQEAECSPNGTPTLSFDYGQQVRDGIVVGADGPHSTLRKSLLSDSKVEILPFVVFNGKRRIAHSIFSDQIQPHMQDSTVLNFRHGDSRLNIAINDYMRDFVSISWTYSRPSHGAEDALHKPNRALSDASIIPAELLDELSTLHASGFPEPFDTIFAPGSFGNDRILHWLMRTTPLSHQALQNLAQQSVFLIGDAAHADPIVGGNGANQSIQDALSLAEFIADTNKSNDDLKAYIRQRHSIWLEATLGARGNIQDLHATKL